MDKTSVMLATEFSWLKVEIAKRLFDGDGLGQVSGLVYVATAADGYVIGKQLQGDDFDERAEDFDGGGDGNDVLDEAFES